MNNETKKTVLEPCETYGAVDYSRYVCRQMTGLETTEFEVHAQDCHCCLQGIRQAAITEHRRKELTENELLYSNALSIMDRLDQSIFSIVIRAVKGVVELIQSTGEQVAMSPALAEVRSPQESDKSARQLLRLVKEFEESKLSVEVTISPVEPDMLDVSVSLLDRQTDEFISDASVICKTENLHLEEITDSDGEANFRVPVAGFYELIMTKDEQLLGMMVLNSM